MTCQTALPTLRGEFLFSCNLIRFPKHDPLGQDTLTTDGGAGQLMVASVRAENLLVQPENSLAFTHHN